MVGGMERLSATDLEGALRFVSEAAAETGPEPFPTHIVESLRTLLGCEWASYSELDRTRKQALALVESPVPDPLADDEDDLFWRVVDDLPLCRAQRRGRFDALKISDFHNRRELHRLEIYADWFRPWGVEYELEVGIPSPLAHTKTFLFDDSRRDFSERDRTLLNVLQPHLANLYRAAEIRRFADTARAVVEDGRDLGERGLLVVDVLGIIEVASPLARRLLDAYAAERDLLEWLEAQRAARRPPVALTIDGPSGTLVAELDRRGPAEIVVLEERVAPAALSTREVEVLALVADGLRNAEIAEALWVSPATVRKHLENIYEKLGVHTRTAAVAQVRGTGLSAG
jgi:DNA-binding CsgD family transcriptional regulator